MSSVETDSAAASQKRLWSENQSNAAVYEEEEAGKFHGDSSDTGDSGKRAGPQVSTNEQSLSGAQIQEIKEKYSSSVSPRCVVESDSAVASNGERKLREAEAANDSTDKDEGQFGSATTDVGLKPPYADSRRAYWRQNNNNYEKMLLAMGVDGRGALSETNSDADQEQRQHSRSPTPSTSSRNISPSDRRAHNQYGTPFSSSTPTPMFLGDQRPGLVQATAPPPAARQHAQFPFFANPFMVPFAPHLPQANVSQQSPATENYPEDWSSNLAGIRQNPTSGGFFLHPQYYHELLQQYLRNMTVNDAGSDDTAQAPDSHKEVVDVPNSDNKAVQKENVVDDAQHASIADKDTVQRDLAGASTIDHIESEDGGVNITESANISTSNKIDDISTEAPAEVEPTTVSRPESLQLEESLSQEHIQSVVGHSDNVNMENPAMALIRKQISEIEKQILRKAQNQNIKKMDAKEIEAFLLMEQQRNLEANLFESTTNSGAWAPSSLPWLQNDAVSWDKAGAVADALSRQQFDAVPDQRSLFELAAVAAAAAAGNGPPNVPIPQLSQQNGFVQAHYPQATSAFVPTASALYPTAMQWPPGSFYSANAVPGFGFPAGPNYFATGGHVPYGGVPHHFVGGAQPYSTAVPPAGGLPPFATHFAPQVQQQRQLEQEAAIRFNEALRTVQQSSVEFTAKNDASVPNSNIGHQNAATQDVGSWREPADDHYSVDHIEEDEPVWVLRESYVRKLKREEERLAQRERNAMKQSPQESNEKMAPDADYNETDTLLERRRNESTMQQNQRDSASPSESSQAQQKKTKKKKEVMIHEPAVLIEGVLFRARYLGSTQLVCDGRPTKATRMMQAQEAVSRIKAPDGEPQPSTDVDLFISTEKIMVLNTDLQRISETDVRQDIMMDHPLRTISYIADIGELVVLMARRVSQSSPDSPELAISRTPKIICHVFESEEAQFIAQSIGQAFQVAYMEFLRANGIDDPGYLRDVDYQEVLNQQEIFGEELEMFARKETQKDVVVPKQKNENLGVVIVESGWGSMLPTVVIANLMPGGPAARSNNLNIGDHIIALNGISFVGLPLSACQNHIKNVKHLTAVKLTIVHTPPVVEVRIKRPDTKYQLGFSVQNGVICSLLRGGIAERGGVRVGHRIIEINSQSVVAVPHEKIVTMLATAVGEIQMKTMPTSMFRLLTGQETPNYI